MESSDLPPLWPDVPEEFCAALKEARVRRGLTLAEISQRTKITESHFVALERADLRHWPKGIFRRAFFSDYARAVGLPVEPALAMFVRLFPDPGAAVETAVADRPTDTTPLGARKAAGELRLALARGPFVPPGVTLRARLAVADAAVIVAAAAAAAWIADLNFAAAVAVMGLTYYSLATVLGHPHPGPAVARRALAAIPAFGRLHLDVAELRTLGSRLEHVVDVGTLRAGGDRAIDAARRFARRTSMAFGRLRKIDLQRLKTATPQVIDRLRERRDGRDGSERPMARPRPDSPRHARRRQSPDGGQEQKNVRIRIRLIR